MPSYNVILIHIYLEVYSMKFFKHTQAVVLAIAIAIMTINPTTAFAAEKSIESDVISATSNSYGIEPAFISIILDQTFNMSGTHTGSTRTYNYNSIGIACSFTDQNGNAITDGTILAIQMYDASTNQKIHEWQGSNGTVTAPSFRITYGGRYYFKYLVAYGSQNLRVHMMLVTAP